MQVIFKDFKKQKVTIDVGLDDTVSLDLGFGVSNHLFFTDVDVVGSRCWLQKHNFY